MKHFILMAAAIVLGLTLSIGDAEAKRLGGGGFSGMQRQSISPSRSPSYSAPRQTATNTAQPPTRRSWMGPLAGLAAGLGLAALASHFGFGEGMANLMLIGLLVVGAMMLFNFLKRRSAPTRGDGLQYAGPNSGHARQTAPTEYLPAGSGGASAGSIPADFDTEGFLRNAKVQFIRLQAANDAGNLEDIREFTTPEMFAEVRMGMAERGDASQETDVVQLDAEVLDVAEETSRYIVSVRFHGLIREEKGAPAAAFDEIWHLTKPISGRSGWVLAGIQQVQ